MREARPLGLAGACRGLDRAATLALSRSV
jgi:hypothetical protein